MNISENNRKYRNEWVEHLELISRIVEKNIKSNEQFFINLINDYVILSKLSFKEINLDENETNKDLAIANVGLDCWDLFLNNIISYSSRFINPIKLFELIIFIALLKTNNVNESMLSNEYKEKKRLEEYDTKLESFIL